MMGVTSLEVYKTVYNTSPVNSKLGILLKEQQLKSYNIDTQLAMNVECLYKTSDKDFVEKANKFATDRYSKNKKLTGKDFDQLKKVVEAFNQQPTNKDRQNSITNIAYFEIENGFFQTQLPAEVYELVDINNTIKQTHSDSDFKPNIQADPISMKSVLTTSNSILIKSLLNKVLGFTNTRYTKELKYQKNQL